MGLPSPARKGSEIELYFAGPADWLDQLSKTINDEESVIPGGSNIPNSWEHSNGIRRSLSFSIRLVWPI